MSAVAIAFFCAVTTSSVRADGAWAPRFERPGLNGTVDQLLAPGDQLIARGDFVIDGVEEQIARWDGSSWRPLGEPGRYMITRAAVGGSELYGAGDLDTDSDRHRFFGRWDGEAWHEIKLDGESSPEVFASFHAGAAIWGYFRPSGGAWRTGITIGSGDDWSFRPDAQSLDIARLVEHDGRLFAFDTASFDSVRVLELKGDSLEEAMPILGASFLDAASVAGRLWVLSAVESEYSDSAALHWWGGEAWISQPLPSDSWDSHIRAVGEELYFFTVDRNDDTPAAYSLAAPGEAWTRIDQRVRSPRGGWISDAVRWRGDLVIAGLFDSIDQVGAQSIAVRRDQRWQALGAGIGVDEGITSMMPFGDELWIGGDFESVGSVWSPGLARWRNGAWEKPPSPPFSANGVLTERDGSLVLLDDRRLAIGDGSGSVRPAVSAGDTVAVRWSGSAWWPLRSTEQLLHWSVAGTVRIQDRLFAFGGFAQDDSHSTPLVECVGEEWTPVPSSIAGGASAAASWSNQLLLAGSFYARDGGEEPSRTFAAWNGADWRLLPEQLSRTDDDFGVRAEDLASFGDLVLVAGNFDWAGELYSPGLVAWDGVRFLRFASGSAEGLRPISIFRLFAAEPDLFAEGEFLDSEAEVVSGIFRWDGTSWSLCLQGDRSGVSRMAMMEDHLLVAFSYASGFAPRFLGEWTTPISSLLHPPALEAAVFFEPNPVRDEVRVRFRGPVEGGARWSLFDVGGRRLGGGPLSASGPVPRVLYFARPELDAMRISSGVYLWSIESGGRTRAARMVVVR